jgi:hypothetical protein
MPARWLASLVALALPASAAAQAPPEQTPQALFEDLLVKDPRTAAPVVGLLRSDAGFVGARPAFADLTGDGRMDAVVQVRIPGAAGTIAVYAFSTDGTSDGRLRAVFRSQALYRATTRVAAGTLTVVVPRWARGDDVCCPAARIERVYGWDARRHRLRRR